MAARMARQESAPNATHNAIIARALRIMEGRLQYRDVILTSPHAVRDYLKLKLADREYEVFVALLLDCCPSPYFTAGLPRSFTLEGTLSRALGDRVKECGRVK
jgi:hypothetical protein